MNTTGRRLSFEWALIDGVNDRDSDIEELARYASSLHAHVNLIPLNPTPGYLVRGSSGSASTTFAKVLSRSGSTRRCAIRAVDRLTPRADNSPP